MTFKQHLLITLEHIRIRFEQFGWYNGIRRYSNFLHDQSWIWPWIKSISGELNIDFHVLTSQRPGWAIALWRHQRYIVTLSANTKISHPWAHKQFTTPVHTSFSKFKYMLLKRCLKKCSFEPSRRVTHSCMCILCESYTLQWRHNERDGPWNHRCLDCLLNRLFKRRSKKTWKLDRRHWPLWGEFTGHRAQNDITVIEGELWGALGISVFDPRSTFVNAILHAMGLLPDT